MKRIFTILFSILTVGAFAQTLDQDYTGVLTGAATLWENNTVAQSFTAGISGELSSVKIDMDYNSCTNISIITGDANIYDGAGTGGGLLSTQSISISESTARGLYTITFDTPAMITAGSMYTLEVLIDAGQDCDGAGTEPNGKWYGNGGSGTGYAGGEMYLNAVAQSPDLYFQTFVNPCAELTTSNPNCSGSSDGMVSVSSNIGTTYTYAWDYNSATTQSITGVPAGAYTVTVTNDAGCTVTEAVTLSDPAAITLTSSITEIDCNSNNTGEIDLTVAGGTTDYTYAWSTGAITEDVTGLFAGVYTVTVTDNNGCVALESATVSEPTALSVTAAVSSNYNGQDVSCNGSADGEAMVTAAGGTTDYTYLWSNGSTINIAFGIGAGSYAVTVTDNNGCTNSDNVTLTEPDAISITSATTDVSCNNGSSGAINVTVSGGTGAFSYMWSNAETSQNATGLMAGAYSLTVQDVNGCSENLAVTISEPSAISVTLSCNAVSTSGGSDGSSSVSAMGGTSPYMYDWGSGYTTVATMTGLSTGNVTVTVKDNNNCIAATEVCIVTENSCSNITVTGSSSNVSCFGGSDGEAMIVMTGGGSTDFTYTWSNGATIGSLTGLVAGTYMATVTDGNSCSDAVSVTITEPVAITGTDAVTICEGDSVMIGGTYESAEGTYSNVIAAGASNGCDSTVAVTISYYTNYLDTNNLNTSLRDTAYFCTGDSVMVGTTWYMTELLAFDTTTSSNGCDSIVLVEVMEKDITVSLTSDVTSICGGDDVTLTYSASGADQLSLLTTVGGNTTTSTITGSSVVTNPSSNTTYKVTATDTNTGCTATSSAATVSVSPNPTVSIQENYYGAPDCADSLTAISTIDTIPFKWSLPGGGLIVNSTGVLVVKVTNKAQTITVTQDGASGCSATASVVVAADASCSPLSVEELNVNNISVYPNPSNGRLTVDLGNTDNANITVLDMTGKLVYQDNLINAVSSVELDVVPGIYFMEVATDKQVVTHKLVIR